MKRQPLARVLVACVAVLLLFSCMSAPTSNHPNLAAAQQLCQQAIDKLTAAQEANNRDMKGHAAKAKQLIQQAMAEIQLAAQAADSH